jgi:hypothetical protein
MPSTVTKGASRAKRMLFPHAAGTRWLKRVAHRWARRGARQLLVAGRHEEVFERPLVTGRDIC